jgi:probable rRNA maturation factor
LTRPKPISNSSSAQALSRFANRAQRALSLRGDVNISITSSSEMRSLNRRFRGKNKATDVLSFPSQSPGVAGDIAISLEIAADSAAELGYDLATEVKILILHGMLHLAGYDHEIDDGEMRAREASLRQKFKLPGGLIERAHSRSVKPTKRGGRRA